ncbi:MAG: AMP-dependent synthetase/ligase [Alphaproteobacteria bacterium]|nr:AMP-dependent synthetase/ligase [Alphaproteobacteria bacterium]
MPALFLQQCDNIPEKTFLAKKIGKQWHNFSYRQTKHHVLNLAAALIKQGVNKGDRVALIADNSPEWIIADLAILFAGGVPVPHYTTYNGDNHLHCLRDAGSVVALVSSEKLLDAFWPATLKSDIHTIFTLHETGKKSNDHLQIISWQQAMEQVLSPESMIEITNRLTNTNRDDLALLSYTSGTNGMPKGVMLQHKAILHNCVGVLDVFLGMKNFRIGSERFLSFLPLSHCYEHTVCVFLATTIGAEVYFAEGIDKISSNMVEVRPTLVTTVPRLCEAIYTRIQTGLKTAPAVSRYLFDLALRHGQRKLPTANRMNVQFSLIEKLLRYPAYIMIKRKIRGRFGGRLRAFVSGGAPLNSTIGNFFIALGVDILQGYGLTETSPVVSFNRPDDNDATTVGLPIKGVEVEIADDGEILIRGDLITQGYWNNKQASKKLFNKDGFLHTGDIGKFDDADRLMITDRKKNLIITSGGDNVAPQYVEGMMLLHPEIEQIVVFGDKKPALAALIVPEAVWLQQFLSANDIASDTPLAKLRKNTDLHKFFANLIKQSNTQLANYEQIRFFDFADEPFTMDNDLLTPSFKIKRHNVIDYYKKRLQALYKKK